MRSPASFLSYHKIVSEAEAGCSFAPVNKKTLILQEADLTALYDCLKELRSEITELRRMKEPPEHRYLSRSEVCDLLHISYSTLHRMTRQGEIRCLKNGRRTLFLMSDVEAAMIPVNA